MALHLAAHESMSFTKPIAFVKAKAAPDIQQQEKNIPKNPFNVPVWAAIPQDEYYLEGIKNGVVVHSTDIIRKSVFTIGRLPSNDISLQHPSISRYHAVVVFKEDGMQYLYDLGSSHGTFLNKQNINSKNFVALHTGDMIRFGASSRLYILHGPERTEARNNRDETQGISWGLKRDAYAGDEWTGKDLQIGAVDRSTIPSDAPYLSDPKQALTVWLRKENEKMNIKFSEDDDGDKISYIARIELPIETGQGPLLAIGFGSKKGKAERDACLEACSKLDKLGVLSENQAEKQLIQKRLNEIKEEAELNDEYLDRTVKKRKVLGDVKSVETFDTLTSKKNDISASIAEIDKQLESLGISK